MAERRTAVKTAAEPNFLQFNDLACEAVGGKVSHAVKKAEIYSNIVINRSIYAHMHILYANKVNNLKSFNTDMCML